MLNPNPHMTPANRHLRANAIATAAANPMPEEMTPREVFESAVRGTAIAVALRDPDAEQRFRFRHTIFLTAMRLGYTAAAKQALALANGHFTMDDAMRHVRKVFAEGKQELKDRGQKVPFRQ
ncbi:hypothetical protein EOA32_00785 [Mesorhizobium sp. M1A.F.Ca.ET.072.01.1.1]|uniref:hypothetical protein n=1 Tax=Mesorhizobium sp. M1A.F.Ca.ET.072.01.1.1 TaxID=2496753 RepID=UPI000FD490B2|nr:hypothetical protein [Mesorhizobium sp. M1A.F.Ca.ET.072.01.1.1]RUW55587.1 hypothetical protein EOA32_00785 [Mesorhizobium sp. M1A.F.Ca.ET.072.01.1.1]